MKVVCFCILLIISLAVPAFGQESTVHLAGDSAGVTLSGTPVWKYHAGDHPEGQRTNLNDEDWEPLTTPLFYDDQLPQTGWPGIGWFRLTFTVDSSLIHVPLFVYFQFNGAAEIYLNGEVLGAYGEVGSSAEEEQSVTLGSSNPSYVPLMFDDAKSPYVLAVRNSNFVAAPFHHLGHLLAGFNVQFGYPHKLIEAKEEKVRRETAIQFAFSLFPAAFALLFGLLYAFQSGDRLYLYFALLALGVAGQTFTDLQLEFVTESMGYWTLRRMLNFFIVFTMLLLMHMVYTLYGSYKLRYYVTFFTVILISGIATVLFPLRLFNLLLLTGAVVIAEIARIVVVAIAQRREGAWIVGSGVLLFILGVSYDIALDLGMMDGWAGITNGYPIGFLGLLVSMAIYLGWRYSQINKNLVHQIEQVQDLSEKNLQQERRAKTQALDKLRLEAENERTQLELEKAKELEQSYKALEAAHQDLKKAQAQLVHAEKMASLGQLTAGIAHELKNPLNFVTNFAQLNAELAEDLHSAVQSGEDVEDVLDDLKTNAGIIEQHGRRANDIVLSMMKHAQNIHSEYSMMDVNKLIDEYITLMQHRWRNHESDFDVSIESSFDENVGEIEMAPQEIGQALQNILANAYESVLEKNASVLSSYEPKIHVSTRRSEGHVKISISDNGKGMSADLHDRVFEPFFTTKPTGSGTGLGLSLSYDIITQGHGGSLQVESEEGEGATFIISLPG